MTLQEEISYEKEVLKHLLKDLKCPENKIREDLLKYPLHSEQLYNEAKRVCEQDYEAKQLNY